MVLRNSNLLSKISFWLNGQRQKSAKLTALIALCAGLLFIIITPPLWGLDEVAHFNRVYEIVNGQIVPQKNSRGVIGNDIPKNLAQLEYIVYYDLADNSLISKDANIAIGRKDLTHGQLYKTIGSQQMSSRLTDSPITASYSPLAYIGPIVMTLIAKLINLPINMIITLGRIGGLITYVILAYFTVRLVQSQKIKWLFIMTLLLPTSIFQASTISADTLTIGFSLFILAAVFSSRNNTGYFINDKKLFYLVSITIFLLSLIKTSNIVFLVLLPLIRFKNTNDYKVLLHKISSVIIIVATLVVWSILVPLDSSIFQGSPRPDGLPVKASAQIEYIKSNPYNFFVVAISTILKDTQTYVKTATIEVGWNNVSLPDIFGTTLVVIYILATIYIKNDLIDNKKMKLLLLILLIFGIGSIFIAMYVLYNPVGFGRIDGVQGRYLIPYIIPLLCQLPLKHISLTFIKKKSIILLFGFVPVLILGVSILNYFMALH